MTGVQTLLFRSKPRVSATTEIYTTHNTLSLHDALPILLFRQALAWVLPSPNGSLTATVRNSVLRVSLNAEAAFHSRWSGQMLLSLPPTHSVCQRHHHRECKTADEPLCAIVTVNRFSDCSLRIGIKTVKPSRPAGRDGLSREHQGTSTLVCRDLTSVS